MMEILKDPGKFIKAFINVPPIAFVMAIIFIAFLWIMLFAKDDEKEDMKESLLPVKDELKNISRLILKLISKIESIENKLQNNKNGLMISVNAIILEEQADLLVDLNDIIDYNHFKEDIEHLKTKLDHSVEKYKTDLHSKLFQTTSDRKLVELVDSFMDINEAIKEIFITEIKKEQTDYEFLKTRIDGYIKKLKTELIKAVYEFYEDGK